MIYHSLTLFLHWADFNWICDEVAIIAIDRCHCHARICYGKHEAIICCGKHEAMIRGFVVVSMIRSYEGDLAPCMKGRCSSLIVGWNGLSGYQ